MTDIVERFKAEMIALMEKADAEIEQLRAEITSLRAASEWRDISTAPRDGTNIDVFCRDGERVTNAYWRNGRWMRFWVNDFETLGHVKLESEPTHWMPLPAPPQRNEVKT